MADLDGGTSDGGSGSCLAIGNVCIPEAYLKASNTEANDQTGISVSLSGDTLAVGSYVEASSAPGVNGNQADNSAVGSGAVYVFRRSGGTWVQEAYLKASNPGTKDNFGFAVSLSGDTLAVGARGESSSATGINGVQNDESASGSGAVYVFRRSGSSWAQEAYLKASNTGANDGFGFSVSLLGDTLAVGALFEDSNATGANGDQADNSASNSGAVYIFQRTGTTWVQEAYLKASNTGASDNFGFSVSLSGDTLAVGADEEDSSATGVNGNQADNSAGGAGAVYVFRRVGATWAQEAYLKASNAESNDHFGFSLSLSGDTLAAGTPFEDSTASGVNGNQADNSAQGIGAAYIFRRVGATWTQEAYLKASNPGFGGGLPAGDEFAFSLSLSGDTLAVGAVLEDSSAKGLDGNQLDNSASESGAVYVFHRSGTTWAQTTYLKATNTDGGDTFGYSVSLSADTLAVSAPGESSSATGVNGNQADNSAVGSGAAYIFR